METRDRFWIGWRLTGIFVAAGLPWVLYFFVHDGVFTDGRISLLFWGLILISALVAFPIAYDNRPILKAVRKHLALTVATLNFLASWVVLLLVTAGTPRFEEIVITFIAITAAFSALILYGLLRIYIDSLPDPPPPEPPPALYEEDGRLIIPADLQEAAGIRKP